MTRGLEARLFDLAERQTALDLLSRDCVANLHLIDLASRMGGLSDPGEMPPEIAGVWRTGELVGVAALRPSVVFDARITPEAVEALLPLFDSVGVGLVKSPAPAVGVLWEQLARAGQRRAVVDRIELAYAVRASDMRAAGGDSEGSAAVRRARRSDLEPLVFAARESLREEGRPDPFEGDVDAFRRWVLGRVSRARVVESEGRLVFTAYADVCRDEGWLIQGVYTWPDVRRCGFASVGVSALCREAFAAGANHVQLAVVEGNVAGQRLYERLGFKPFVRLRTILFT